MEIRVHSDPFSGQTQIAIFIKKGNKRYLCNPFILEFEEFEEGSNTVEPTLRLGKQVANEFLQELSTALNQAGYRDSNTESYASELAATNKHLEDMRKLVFKES